VRRPLVTTGVIAIPLLGVAAYFVYGRGFVNADIMWALSWGDELAQLRQPSFTAAGTPTPHPLVNFATALLSPLGQGAERAWHVIGYLSIGALLYATWSLGTTLFGRWAGLLAAALVATRATVVFYGPLAYLDLPYTALLIWALVLEARRPRRGTPVLVILAIAGLLRPEAWILAGLYWLWLLPAVDRATAWRALMLVAVAPVLWALADLVATGDPMFSFTHTTHGSVEARPHGVFDLITQGPRLLGQEARPAVVAIAAVGYLLALRHSVHGWRLVAWTTATAVAFSVPVAAGTIANGRYLLPTVVLLCVTAAACITGWSTLFGRARNVWQLCAIVGAIVLLVTIPAQVSRLGGVRDTVVTYRANREGFRRVVTSRGALLTIDLCEPPPVPDGRVLDRDRPPRASGTWDHSRGRRGRRAPHRQLPVGHLGSDDRRRLPTQRSDPSGCASVENSNRATTVRVDAPRAMLIGPACSAPASSDPRRLGPPVTRHGGGRRRVLGRHTARLAPSRCWRSAEPRGDRQRLRHTGQSTWRS
jgi:hypothetical protein